MSEHAENDLEMVGTSGATVSLDDLVGSHLLDGVDMFNERVETWGSYEDASCIRFRLDGITYTAVEDPEDGYRSCLDRLFVDGTPIKNSFQPLKVVARKKGDDSCGKNDTLELIDADNGNTVLEVGTDNVDDYYPYFVASFWPERMSINNPKDYPA